MSVPLSTAPLLRSTHQVLSWTRLSLAVQCILYNLVRLDEVRHPILLLAISICTLLWTLLMAQWNRLPTRLRHPLVGLDVIGCLLVILASTWVIGPEEIALNGFVPAIVFWYCASALSVAVVWGSLAGLGVGALFSVACLIQSDFTHDMSVWAAGFAVCLAAWGAGEMVDQLRRALSERDRSLGASIALAERDRMNRIVHDGALQVLSLVEREGRDLGPRGERLAQLARQQEIQLRSVLQDRTVDDVETSTAEVDVTAMLDAMASDRVTVSVMAGAVMMPAQEAAELQAAVAQALRNTELHAGAEAESWILLEEEDGCVIVSVRDNGEGMSSGQLEAAIAAGRLGIRHSIIGRIEELGGTAQITSSPGRGVEWELRVPLADAEERRAERA